MPNKADLELKDKYQYAVQSYVKGRFSLTLDTLSELIKLRPENPDYLLNRGIIHLDLLHLAAAYRDFAEAKKLAPEHPDLPVFLAKNPEALMIWANLSANHQTIEILSRRVLDILSKDKPIGNEPEDFHKKFEQQKEYLEKALVQFPHCNDFQEMSQHLRMQYQTMRNICFEFAKLKAKQHQENDAIRLWEFCILLNPKDTDASIKIAKCFQRRGQYEKAVELLKAALENTPDDSNIEYHLARCFEALKKPANALIYYIKVQIAYPYGLDIVDAIKRTSRAIASPERNRQKRNLLFSGKVPLSNKNRSRSI